METIYHPESTRSFKDLGWLKLYQSFHPNYPPALNRKNFGVLVVFDNGFIMPGGKGFGMHPHKDIEIASIVVYGAMVHSDTAGHNGVNVENAIQLISAGTGVQHSEYNHSLAEEIDNLQIWFLPKEKNKIPNYQTMASSSADRSDKWQLLLSPDAADNSLLIGQDVWMWRGNFKAGKTIDYKKKLISNGIYLYIINGKATAKDQKLAYRDGLGIPYAEEVIIEFDEDTDILLIDVPMQVN